MSCRVQDEEDCSMSFALRRAAPSDADAITNVYSASFRMLTFLPILHTVEEDRWFITNVILKECEVTVAEDENGIVALLDGWGLRGGHNSAMIDPR
jgi:hypothetical protein